MINPNQVANSNLVTSSAASASSAAGSGSASQSNVAAQSLGQDLDQFLKLLTTQLKNQDPTDPTDTNALTQQIATLSQVEQQINTNKNLEKLLTAYSATQYNSVVSYIGKQIEAPGDVLQLKGGQGAITYYMGQEAQRVNVTVTDESGATVYTGTAATAAGRNNFVWDGKNNAGVELAPGTYHVKFTATAASGDAINVASYITGVVTSIDSSSGNVYASIGDISVLLSKITSISLPPTAGSNS